MGYGVCIDMKELKMNAIFYREGPESPSLYGVSGAGTRRSSSPYANGRTELLIGEDNNKLKASTGSVESNNNKLNIENEIQQR